MTWSSCGAERAKPTEAQRRWSEPENRRNKPKCCHQLPPVGGLDGRPHDPLSIRKGSTSICGRARNQSARFWVYWDGTVMEQRGRNRWQTFGPLEARKWLELVTNRWPPAATVCRADRRVNRTSAVGCHRLREVPSPRRRGSSRGRSGGWVVDQASWWATRVTAAPLCDICYSRARVRA